jgi:hypothetical protein
LRKEHPGAEASLPGTLKRCRPLDLTVFLVQILEWQIDLLNNPASSFNPASIYTKTISLILFDNVLSNTDQTLREAL